MERQQVCGKHSEDEDVAKAMARLREQADFQREAKRYKNEQDRARELGLYNEKERLQRLKDRLFEEKVILRLAMEKTNRDQESMTI